MTRVPWWGLLSSALAPVLLIGGWTLAATRQPDRFDSARDTISALAARGAADRWVMTGALVGVGICHMVTASALRPVAVTGRAALAVGGLATVAVAGFPLPTGAGHSGTHSIAAGVAFVALTAWPALGTRTGEGVPAQWPLRPAVGRSATAGLAVLLGWFVLEMAAGGADVGLSERVAAGAQALWPLVTVVSLRATMPAKGPRG